MPTTIPTPGDLKKLETRIAALEADLAVTKIRLGRHENQGHGHTVVTLPDPPPPTSPVDCALSDWALTSFTDWSVCGANSLQTRTETWTRTVLTAPSGGGVACGPLSEQRIGSQACVYDPEDPPDDPPADPSQLTFSDFTYLGCFALPSSGYSGTDILNGWGRITGRRVAGQTRIFVEGAGGGPGDMRGGIVELIPPVSLAPDSPTAGFGVGVRATISRDWGVQVYSPDPNLFKQNSGTLANVHGGILYHEGKLFYQWFYSYNVGNANDRCVAMATLNDSTGVATPYGPWRYDTPGVKFLCGYMASIPSDFATAYLGGRTLGLGQGSGQSGVASTPWGITCFPVFTPTTSTPASLFGNATHVVETPLTLVSYDYTHRQPVSAVENLRRRLCTYAEPGNCSTASSNVSVGAPSVPVANTALYAGADSAIGAPDGYYNAYIAGGEGYPFLYQARSTTSGAGSLTGIPASGTGALPRAITSGERILLGKYDNARGGVVYDPIPFLGPDTAGGEFAATFFDFIGSPVWIRTSTGKSGILYSANLADAVAGGDYGTDDRPHVRYSGQATCPHGQFAASWSATGPCSTTTVQAAFLYSEADFARLAQGTLSAADLRAQDYSHWEAITPEIPAEPANRGGVSSMYFDSATDRLYVCERYADSYTFGSNAPLHIIHVFHLA